MVGPVESEASPDPPGADTSPVGVRMSPDANTVDVSTTEDTGVGATGLLLYEHQSNPSETAERNIFDGRLSTVGEHKSRTETNVQATATEAAENAQAAAEDAVNEARNVGPDYLDELTGLVVGLAVLIAGLWLVRPLLTIGANVSG